MQIQLSHYNTEKKPTGNPTLKRERYRKPILVMEISLTNHKTARVHMSVFLFAAFKIVESIVCGLMAKATDHTAVLHSGSPSWGRVLS